MNKLNKLLLALAFISSPALAATSTANFTTTATLNSSCTVSAPDMSFGSITAAPTGSINIVSAISYTCSNKITAKLGISKGGGNSIYNRSMGGTNGNTDRLHYNIYSNQTASAILAEADSVNFITLTPNGTAQSVNVYGQLLLNQYVKADNYSDSLIVSIIY